MQNSYDDMSSVFYIILCLIVMNFNALYSSISGNTKYVVWLCQNYLQTHGHILSMQHCSLASPHDMITSDYTILACPTYGHGRYDQIFADYLDQCNELDLQSKKYIIISL